MTFVTCFHSSASSNPDATCSVRITQPLPIFSVLSISELFFPIFPTSRFSVTVLSYPLQHCNSNHHWPTRMSIVPDIVLQLGLSYAMVTSPALYSQAAMVQTYPGLPPIVESSPEAEDP